MKRFFLLAALFLLASSFLGCGSKDNRLPCFPVEGKILANGEPASGVTITFHAVDPKNATPVKPGATTAQDGSYILSTYDMLDGAPAGDYTVTILWEQANEEGKKVDRLRGAYADPATTKYKTTVRDQPNNTYNIELRVQE